MGENDVTGWHVWQSHDGGRPARWYVTRIGQRNYPEPLPDGWAMTVDGPTVGDVRNAISGQIALDRRAARAVSRARGDS